MADLTFAELQRKMQIEKQTKQGVKYPFRTAEDINNKFKSLDSGWSVSFPEDDIIQKGDKLYYKAVAVAKRESDGTIEKAIGWAREEDVPIFHTQKGDVKQMQDPQWTDAMSAGLNAIDEHERLMRVDVVRATFEDKCMVAGIEKSTFADKYDEYSLKKYFKTGKYELKKTTLDEMDGLVLSEFDALEEYKANKQAIQEQAQEYDLPADSYIRHLEDGKSLVDILKMMKTDRDAEIARKEQKEIQEKAKAERLEEIAQSAKKNANANIKAYDAETGEILEQGTITPEPQNNEREVAKFEPSEPLVKLVRLELHGGLEQWENTQEYFEDNFIGFETLED